MTYNSDFLKAIGDRGFISDCTDNNNLDLLLRSENPVPIYIGFDCTAPSLHVGSLVQIMALRWVQKSGHKPIILMGGGTTKIGDPSGKDESRKMLSDEDIASNMEGIKNIFINFMNFEDKFDATSNKAFMVNNDDWLSDLGYIELLRKVGHHFSMSRMLSMESVKRRLEREDNMSFLEFNYMIMQAYDFVELNKQYNCRLQIGGSDQWGNIVNGVELQRRVRGKNIYGLTTPLITTASGGKMGKTADGAVWLNNDMCSAYDYWQFWRNTEDTDVIRFMKFFTDFSIEEIAKYEKLEGADINKAKIILANAATTLCHGEKAAKAAEETAQKVFQEGTTGDALPIIKVERSRLEEGISVYKLFCDAGLEQSGGAARRLIKGGGAKINDIKVIDAESIITTSNISNNGFIKLSAGKKRHALIEAS